MSCDVVDCDDVNPATMPDTLRNESRLAEVISFNDYVTLGGEAKSKEAGKMRLEGKDYIVKDGDVMHFRFNV